MTARTKRFFIYFAAAIIILVILNIDVSIRCGIDGQYRDIHMPLYVKWIQFMSRNYDYARLSREITRGAGTDEEKALLILKWTHNNIKDVPAGMPVADDHIWNIIVRRYGSPEQFQDVFTTLCRYAGLRSFWYKFYGKNNKAKYSISFVRTGGRWLVFDAYTGIYFKNGSGEIASAGDIVRDPSLIDGKDVEGLWIWGIPYKDFYYNFSMEPFKDLGTLRPEKQMPMPRLLFEIKKAIGLEKEEARS